MAPKTPANSAPPAPETPPAEAPDSDLVVVHNLDHRKLQHAHELGGLAAPSLAVKHKDHDFDSFGNISLVGHRDLVDPKKGVDVFDADVYSPRHPRALFKLNSKAVDRHAKEIKQHNILRQHENTSGVDFDEVGERGYAHNEVPSDFRHASKLKYIATVLGKKVEPHYRPSLTDEPASHPQFQEWLRQNPAPNWSHGDEYHKKLSDAYKATIEPWARDRYKQQGMDLMHQEDPAEEPSEEDYVKDRKERFITGSRLHRGYFDGDTGLLHFAMADSASKPMKPKVDHYKTQDAINAMVPDGDPKWQAWHDDHFKDLVGDRYFMDGAKKKAYTISNIVDSMTRKGIRGQEGFNYGLGTARSKGASQLTDLQHIRNASHSLRDGSQFKVEKEGLDKEFGELADTMEHHSEFSGSSMSNLAEALGDYYKMGPKAFARHGFKGVPKDLQRRVADFANKLRGAGTQYFEAKPQRAVGLNEFHGAAIPHDSPQETVDILRHHGVEPVKYHDPSPGYPPPADGLTYPTRKEAIQQLAAQKKLYLSEADLCAADGVEDLQKMQTPPAFPGLGVHGVRSQTPIIENEGQAKTKILGASSVNVATARDWGNADHTQAHLDNRERRLANPPAGVRHGGPVNSAYSMSTKVRRDLNPGVNIGANSDIATVQHENFHDIMGQVEAKHGKLARQQLAVNVVKHLEKDRESGGYLWGFKNAVSKVYNENSPQFHEEVLAKLHNYMNDPAERQNFWGQHGHGFGEQMTSSKYHDGVKKVWRNFQAVAAKADHTWTQYKPGMSKSEEDLQKAQTDLGLTETVSDGTHFKTSKPVKFTYFRNNSPSPKADPSDRFQQKLEPHGRFVTHISQPPPEHMRAHPYEHGEIEFKNPLVLHFNNGAQPHAYDQNSWKARLAQHFKKKGRALSQHIMGLGHDGIVTVDHSGNSSEIVDLRPGIFKSELQKSEASECLYEDPQECPDIDCAHNKKVVALVMVTDGYGRLLIGHTTEGQYTLPGGHVEDGEDPEQGALREVREEAALDLTDITLIHQESRPGIDLYLYSAMGSGNPHGQNDPDGECESWEWVDTREGIPKNIWDNLKGPPGELNFIRRLFESQKLQKTDMLWDQATGLHRCQ